MIANARMYAVNATVAAAWSTLFDWVAKRAGVLLEVVAHPPPQPLADLWRREDLGCAFMCGYPWSVTPFADRPRLLAAPIPSPARYEGRPVYCSDIVVRNDSPIGSVASLRGARFSYTLESSQSGWHAPRQFFAGPAISAGGRWFGDVVGPLETPRGIVQAVIEGRADAGPLDSYWHDLLRRHEPLTAGSLRTITSTPMTVIPPLVSANAMSDHDRQRLSEALAAVAGEGALRDVRETLLILGFAAPSERHYAALAEGARQTDALGYAQLA